MDNQQITQTELAWLAGIWDGEGTISLRRNLNNAGRQGALQVSPRVSMVNTNAAILERVCDILNRMDVHYYMREKGAGGFEGSHRQCWIIAVETLSQSIKLLTALRPFLIGKRFQADCLLQFVQSRLEKTARRKGMTSPTFNKQFAYTSEELGWCAQIVQANGDQRGISEAIRQAAVGR